MVDTGLMTSGKEKLVYCFSREPGGAEVLSLVLESQANYVYCLIGKDYACNIFDLHGLTYTRYQGNTREELFTFFDGLQKKAPASVVLTSAASVPELDMTEKYVWKWALSRSVPSIAVLDQWQNYKERFSGPNGTDVCQYLPDIICVMDESARQSMVSDGLPAERIEVVGHPSLARLRRIMTDRRVTEKEAVRKSLGLTGDQQLVLFVSEPFSQVYGDRAGYTELTILEELISYLQERSLLLKRNCNDIKLVVKLHPKNSAEVFEKFKNDHAGIWETLRPVVITGEIEKISVLAASDLVVGMASIMLMEAIALGKPTVSIQVGARLSNLCEAVNQEIIPFISTRDEMQAILNRLLDDLSYREKYSERIRNYPIIDNADSRIWERIESLKLK